MAFTKEEHENLLKEIAMSGGDTDNMLKLLQKLRDDFDEREGELRSRGETADKTDPATEEEKKEIVEDSKEDDRKDGGLRRDPMEGYVSQSEYDALRKKYIDRFFGGARDAIENTEEDVKKDENSDEITYDGLFKKREG